MTSKNNKKKIVLFLLLPTKQQLSLSFCGSLSPDVLVQGSKCPRQR